MNEYKVIYRNRDYNKSIHHTEIIKAYCINDAMWEAFRHARCVGLDAEVWEI